MQGIYYWCLVGVKTRYFLSLLLSLFSISIAITIIVSVSVFVIMTMTIIIIIIVITIIIIIIITLGIFNHQCMLHNMVRFGHNNVINSGFKNSYPINDIP